MAEPFDSALTLQSVANIIRNPYYSKLLQQPTLTGAKRNRLFTFDSEPVTQDGKEVKFKRYMADSFRPDTDALSGFGTPRAFRVDKIKVRWNERDASAHDFTKLAGTGRISEYDVSGASSDGAIVDIADTVVSDFRRDFDFKRALFRSCPQSGQIGATSASTATKLNDAPDYANCSAYSNGATVCRVLLDGTSGAIGWFREGLILDIYSGSSLVADSVQVVENPNSIDQTIAVALTSASTVANLDSITTSCAIYLSGARNKGFKSVELWMTRPTTSAAETNFIGGVDRNSTAGTYRDLLCHVLRAGSSDAQINKSFFDTAADSLANKFDQPDVGYAVCAYPTLITTLRNQFEAAALIPWPTDNPGRKTFANLGSSGLNYQHPALGVLSFQGDPFMIPDRVDMLAMGDWMEMYYGQKGMKIMRGAVDGMWDRMESTDPTNPGKTMFWQFQAYSNHCDFCTYPQRQVRIANLTA